MSAELRPENCPLYPLKESAEYEVEEKKYVVIDLGVTPLPRTRDINPPCLALELPKWNPNVHNRANCQRCRSEIDITPKDSPWAKSS